MITLYSKPLCPYCDSAEKYLKNNNIKYRKVDISEDTAAYEFVKSKGHKTVPQIYYSNRLLVEGGYHGLSKILPQDLAKKVQQYDADQGI